MLLDDDTAEMVAIRTWAPDKGALLWGCIHEENRANHIRVVRAVAEELVKLGWMPPQDATGG